MATAITTVTKKASVVKTTKGSEKKWTEVLAMNRRHDLQLPVDIAKYNTEFKRTYNCQQRQQSQTERLWANKHETWYHDDYLFRNHLLKQLKPITRRFKHINSISLQDNEDQQPTEILNQDEIEILSVKKSSNQDLPPLKNTNKYTTIQSYQNFNSNQFQPRRPKVVFSKLICSKVSHECTPRLYSHHHGPFLDVAQRFLKRKPEMIEKGVDYHDKQRQQKQYLKMLIENEQERTRLATIKFGEQLDNEKIRDNYSNDFDDDENEDYY